MRYTMWIAYIRSNENCPALGNQSRGQTKRRCINIARLVTIYNSIYMRALIAYTYSMHNSIIFADDTYNIYNFLITQNAHNNYFADITRREPHMTRCSVKRPQLAQRTRSSVALFTEFYVQQTELKNYNDAFIAVRVYFISRSVTPYYRAYVTGPAETELTN